MGRKRKTLTKTDWATQCLAYSQVKQMTWCTVDDYCILVTQNTNKEVEKKTWIEIIPRLSHFSLHNRKDDSSEGYFSRHTKHANMFDANLLAWQPKLLADLFNLWL